MNTIHLKISPGLYVKSFEFGKTPKVLLIAGMHGNEKTGVRLLNAFISELKNKSDFLSVAVIPIANPQSYKANSRLNPIDNADLNRIFPVTQARTVSFKLAKVIQEYAEGFDLIVDLHVFTYQHTLSCGVDLNTGSIATKRKIRNLMALLKLEAICKIDHKSEPKKDGSLCGFLQSKNKLAFGVELAPHNVMAKKKFEQVLISLPKLIRNYPLVNSLANSKLPIYERQQIFHPRGGKFIPIIKPGKHIKLGQNLGYFSKGTKKSFFKSPYSGTLISISYKRNIPPNGKIAVVGK